MSWRARSYPFCRVMPIQFSGTVPEHGSLKTEQDVESGSTNPRTMCACVSL
jgi:hypothetical protein